MQKPPALLGRRGPTWFHPSLTADCSTDKRMLVSSQLNGSTIRLFVHHPLAHSLAVTGRPVIPYFHRRGEGRARFERSAPGGFSRPSGREGFQPVTLSLCDHSRSVLVPVSAFSAHLGLDCWATLYHPNPDLARVMARSQGFIILIPPSLITLLGRAAEENDKALARSILARAGCVR
jgi:hypothetical protein